MSDIAIEVSNISMQFRLSAEKVDSLKDFLIRKIRNNLNYNEFSALDNVSFNVKKGEVLGIVGMNGAGKSTLLKIIAGVMKPTSGSITKNGTVAPLIELGAGFNGELNAIENIYLNGMLLGYSKKFINSKLEEIIDYAELDKFIYSPIKSYSSGMKARLGFSIATIVKPDILIVDEVLAVGDYKFREKSEAKILSMMEGGTTVLFVSHSLDQVQKLCARAVLLEKGAVKGIGPVNEIIEKYKV